MMKLEDMWRQSDKSYIHPTDMHDKHIINAIKRPQRNIRRSLATIQSARAVEDWNATYQHRHEYKSNALLRLRLRGR